MAGCREHDRPCRQLPPPGSRKGRLRSEGPPAAAQRGAGRRPTFMTLASLCASPVLSPGGGLPSPPPPGGCALGRTRVCQLPGSVTAIVPSGQAQNSTFDLHVLHEARCSGRGGGGRWDCGRTRMRGSETSERRRRLCRRGSVCGLVLSGSRRGQAVCAGVQVQVMVRREQRRERDALGDKG